MQFFHRLSAFFSRWQQRVMCQPSIAVVGTILFVVGAAVLMPGEALAQDTGQVPGVMDQLVQYISKLLVDIAGIMQTLIAHLVKVLIVVMQYDGFVSSPVVETGWAIVRDAVNMFFVVVLIVIAFGTIFGVERFKWQQQVPRLLIFAIVINFSKTLAGIMIDFGQVFMLTFVNAIADIAGGNFIQLFGLNEINSLANDSATSLQAGDSGFQFFMAAVTAVLMTATALVGILILVVALVARTVMLWILITLAPLAWFAGGARDVVAKLGEVYAAWWKHFTCAVSIGPILAFFLWLTLAVVGGGQLAAESAWTQAIQSSGGAESPGAGVSAILHLNTFIPFIMGIGMIFAGVQVATEVCQQSISVGRMAKGRALRAGGVTRRVVGAPAAFVGRGALRGARYGARAFGVREGAANLLRKTAETVPLRGVASLAGRGADALERQRAEEISQAGEKLRGASQATQEEYLRTAAGPAGPATTLGEDEAISVLSDWMKKPEDLEDLGEENVKNLWKRYGDKMETRLKGDADAMKSLQSFKKSRPDIALSDFADKKMSELSTEQRDELKNTVSDMYADFDDVREADPSVFAGDDAVSETFRAQLDEMLTDYTDDDGNAITAREAILRGRAGKTRRDALQRKQPSAGKIVAEAYDSESGQFTGDPAQRGANQRRFKEELRQNPSSMSELSTETFQANNGNNDVSVAAGDVFQDKKARSQLTTQYALATTDEERSHLKQAADNARTALQQRAQRTGDPADEKSVEIFESAVENIESQFDEVPEPRQRPTETAEEEATGGASTEEAAGETATAETGAAGEVPEEEEEA